MTLVRPKSHFSYGKVRVAFRLHILTEYRMDMQERSLFLISINMPVLLMQPAKGAVGLSFGNERRYFLVFLMDN